MAAEAFVSEIEQLIRNCQHMADDGHCDPDAVEYLQRILEYRIGVIETILSN